MYFSSQQQDAGAINTTGDSPTECRKTERRMTERRKTECRIGPNVN
jgi:hypothetical protein